MYKTKNTDSRASTHKHSALQQQQHIQCNPTSEVWGMQTLPLSWEVERLLLIDPWSAQGKRNSGIKEAITRHYRKHDKAFLKKER